MMMNGMGMMGFGFMSLYWILSALILIAGILLVLWAIVRVVRRGSLSQNDKEHDHAVRLLKERYARGEIDREEYLQRLKDLRD
ncbi:SHOCT domain-containing protein [Alicyclobacillus macrosporangiidus]|uniref:SHOCT domain-containing protein n=1 Tax=Alicyclobacillus macrosporangiidus TaxID=392015 RepID=UPI000A631ADB|nr:SHOCT domain-containing protein [Alicyclobacillus macrosporangiidus]